MLESGQDGLIGPGSNNYRSSKPQGFFSRKDIGGLSDQQLLEALQEANKKKSQVRDGLQKDMGKVVVIDKGPGWTVVSFIGQSTEPQTIERLSDNQQFSIGDYVTNGTQMRGHIERFEFSFKGGDIYVFTDWSGVGMNLDSLQHVQRLPSAFQLRDEVVLDFGEQGEIKPCKVIKVHFTENKVLYDVEVSGKYQQTTEHPAGGWVTRLYNIESSFVRNKEGFYNGQKK